jgi:hypothetical protein
MSQDESVLEIEKMEFYDRFPLNQGQKNIIEDVISWKTQPPLVKTGRSTFLIIQEPSLPFKGIKIKGCGYFDPYSNAVMQPSVDEGYEAHIQQTPDGVTEVHYQMEVNDEDEIYYSKPKKRPFGAQVYDQAVKEFEAYKVLLKAWDGDLKDFPFYFPIGYAKYKDMNYIGKPLGVAIFGIGTETEKPLGNYFAGQFEEKGLRISPQILEYWQNTIAPLGKKEPTYFDILLTLQHLAREFGKSLSNLHEHFVDHDSHLFNAAVDNENGHVMIFDLDHVKHIDELSAQKYFYYALKDFEIGLVAIMSNIMLSGYIEGVHLFQDQNMNFEQHNILRGFFEGYFGEISDDLNFIITSMWKRLLIISAEQLIKAEQKDHLAIAHNFCEQEREVNYLDIFPYLKEKIKTKKPKFELSKTEHAKIIEKLLNQKSQLSKEHNVT